MHREFMGYFNLLQTSGNTQRAAIDFLLGKGNAPDDLRHFAEITDPLARMDLLAQALLTSYKDYARAGLRREGGGLPELYRSRMFQEAMDCRYQQMNTLGLMPALPDMDMLPFGSFALTFTFTLRTPYISKDDVSLHILDNPVRKDRVFGLPMVASTTWKGLLRATMMQPLASDLLSKKIDENVFVKKRLQLYRLFGNEADGAAEFLARAWAQFRAGPRPENRDETAAWKEKFHKALEKVSEEFDRVLREKKYRIGEMEGFQGALYFYPTFFTRLSLEVINPHDRQSNAGKQPIYFECVPDGAHGTFSLLYAPFDLIGADEAEIRRQALADLQLVAEGLKEMFLTYGFSAKRTSGYGVAEETVTNGLLTGRFPGRQAPTSTQPWPTWTFRSFTELVGISARIAQQLQGGTR